ncbi:MAG: glycosyltransferase family 2 protein, partial [Duncaniella sp.]|nr:glycosyltransferase family 2 protein [Duncaniella sp.]
MHRGINPRLTIFTAISMVIPVYNREHTLPRTLRSIEDLGVWPRRLILVDNNSTDNSWEIMQQWSSRMKERKRDV